MAARRMALAVRLITTMPMVRRPVRPTERVIRRTTTMRMVRRQGLRTGRET